jgi:hypothetical protein
MREIWVDYNDLDRQGQTTTLSQYAEPGADLSVGASILTGDDDGNLCQATITGIGRDGVVALRLDLGSFSAADNHSTALAYS